MMTDKPDPILDAFLREAFSQAGPPDLSDRVVDAWSRETQSADAEREASVTAPLPAPPVAPPEPPPHPTAFPSAVVEPTRSPRNRTATGSRTATGGWPKLVLAVAVALALLTLYLAAVQSPDRIAEEDSSPETQRVAQQDPPTTDHDHQDATPEDLAVNESGSDKPSAFDQPAPFEREPQQTPATAPPRKQRPQPIETSALLAAMNDQLSQTWAVNQVEPAVLATDSEFCRRAFLAMIGRIPTVAELQAFLERDEPNKREWLVDRLQNHRAYRPYYVANWTTFWTNLLIGRTGGQGDSLASREGLVAYLEQSVSKGKPADQMVRELLTAEGVNTPGEPRFNGAVNFLLDGYTNDATLAASRTARIFLGRQLQCVQCHNHPTNEDWTQNRFWEFNAFFRQMRVERGEQGRVELVDRSLKSETPDSDEAEIYYEQLDGRKRVAYPRFFDGREIEKSGDIHRVKRREALAEFVITSDDFSRAIVNRVWARFFQFGLANPIDDLGEHNPPQHPELLQLLADQFVAADYDLDQLVRWIALSDAFQRSSKAQEDSLADNPAAGTPLFSRYYTRQISPEAVYDSLLLAANAHHRGTSNDGSRTVGNVQAQRAWVGEFSKNMNTDEGQETDTFSGDIRQSVVVMTSPLMKQAVSNQLGGVLHQVTNSSMPLPKKIEHLFLAALSRKPTARELKAMRSIVDPRDPAAGLQDIWWALLNSNEFILDH